MTTGGDDLVSARINFELPPEALSQMRDFNTELERVKVNTEQAARGVGEFARYISLMEDAQSRAEESSRNLAASMSSLLQIQERAGNASAGTAVPQMYTQPFAEGTPGTGRDRTPLPTTVPQSGDAFSHLAANDPRAYLNARAAWGGGQQGELPPVSISQQSLDQLARRIADRDQAHGEQAAKTGDDGGGPAPAADPGTGRGRQVPARQRTQQTRPPWEAWRDRAAQWAGTAGSVAGAMGPGSSSVGALGMVGRALQGWGARRHAASISDETGGTVPRTRRTGGGGSAPSVPTEGETEESGAGGEEEGGGGGGMGGLGQAAGWGGAGIGAIVGGIAAVGKIGSEIQQYRALGQIRGGGVGEGLGYEMQARMMAMNPFLKTDQARQIMQSALTEGYTGKEFDSVTDFMTHNLTEMNMSVADSTKMLHEATRGSNKSVGELTKNMEAAFSQMKMNSQFGYNTLPARTETMMSVFDSAMAGGASPQVALQQGSMAGNLFANQPGMADVGKDLNNAANSNLSFQMLAMGVGGIDPKTVKGYNPADPGSFWENLDPKQRQDVMFKTLKRFADQCTLANGDCNLPVWMSLLNRFGIPEGQRRDTAKKLWVAVKGYGTGGPDDPSHPGKTTTTTGPAGLSGIGSMLGGMGIPGLGDIGSSIMGGLGDLGNMVAAPFGAHPFGGSAANTPDLGQIASKVAAMYGGGEVEVGSGNSWGGFDPTNQQQLKDLQSGKAHVRKKGDTGPGMGIDQLPSMGGGAGTGGSGGGANAKPSGNMTGQLQIQVHPASMRQVLGIPQYVPLTANEQQANAGYGTAVKANPPPGDGITSRGFR